MFRLFLAAAPAALLAFSSASAEPVSYEFDLSHTVVSASWDHQGYSQQSLQFTDFSGTLDLDLETPANSTVDITFNLIDGLWAGAHHARFITHLNTGDFFDTAITPTAHFVGTSFETEDGETGVMTGDLTMNGQTHPSSLTLRSIIPAKPVTAAPSSASPPPVRWCVRNGIWALPCPTSPMRSISSSRPKSRFRQPPSNHLDP